MIKKYDKSVGILLIATWKYNRFIEPLLADIEKYLFPHTSKKIFLHTDSKDSYNVDKIISIKHHPWPIITLNRFKLFSDHMSLYDTDYLVYLDIDSQIISTVDTNILSDFFVVEHSCWKNTAGTPERNPKSTAYIPHGSNNTYVAGGFFGGSKKRFSTASTTMKNNIKQDLRNNIIALWHDESHLNRYVFDNQKNITILDHSYMYSKFTNYKLDNPKILPYENADKGFNKFENMVHK